MTTVETVFALGIPALLIGLSLVFAAKKNRRSANETTFGDDSEDDFDSDSAWHFDERDEFMEAMNKKGSKNTDR